MADETTNAVMTAPEVAAYWHTKVETIVRALKRGELPGLYLGTREGWRVARCDALAWRSNTGTQAQVQEAHDDDATPSEH